MITGASVRNEEEHRKTPAEECLIGGPARDTIVWVWAEWIRMRQAQMCSSGRQEGLESRDKILRSRDEPEYQKNEN